VDAAARRQKWIDQAQSLNIYISNANGKKLDVTYRMAWFNGLKTTYYLRALGATQAEKSTINRSNLNAVESTQETFVAESTVSPIVCNLNDPDCESCQ
jgi:ribonucleoside-diphosphate reductase alpha chain